MESSYKRIGDYIQQVDVRNSDSSVTELIGVSISKTFMESVANTIGTDLSKYKVISKGQFACSLMQVSRDGGIAISLYKENTPAIMSPAYYIFEVSSKELLAEYLELVVYNPMFDREAVFNAIGGVRGTLSWEEFCDMKINLPSIEEQQKIVRQYKTITDRIEVLEKINEKLIRLCLVLYKSTFDNVDYPMGKLEELITVKYGKDHQALADGNIPLYGSGGIMRYVEKPLYTEESVLIPRKGSLNNIMYVNEPFWSVDTMFYTQMKKDNVAKYVYFFLKAINMSELNSGSAVPSMTTKTLNDMDIKIPDKEVLAEFDKQLTPMFETINANVKEIGLLRSIDIRL